MSKVKKKHQRIGLKARNQDMAFHIKKGYDKRFCLL